MRNLPSIFLSIAFISVAETAYACKGDMFAAMDGKWRGTGIARLSKNASEETITCQVSDSDQRCSGSAHQQGKMCFSQHRAQARWLARFATGGVFPSISFS